MAAAILYGREINMQPMTSLTAIAIIKGKPSLSAESMRGLVLAAGHHIRVIESNSSRCVIAGRREGDDYWTEMQFSMDDAKRAGLTGGNWSKYPQEMLTARASTRLCRAVFPDVIAGLRSVEESEEITPDATPPPAKTGTRKRRGTKPTRAAQASVAATEPEPDLPPLPVVKPAENTPPPRDKADTGEAATTAQVQKIAIQTKELGQESKPDRLNLIGTIVGHPIESSKDLLKSEAQTVIDELALIQAAKDPAAALAFTLSGDAETMDPEES